MRAFYVNMADFFDKEENEKEENNYYGIGNFLLEIVKVFFLALIIIMPIRIFVFQPFFVQGDSMEPNFKDRDYLIINELGYKFTEVGLNDRKLFSIKPFKDFERGDVVIFRYPKDPRQYFIKRIIALPGEKITISNNQVIIKKGSETVVLDESDYLDEDKETKRDTSQILADDEYFVMGDNRPFSSDSRSWGVVKESDMIGKVLIRLWPFDEFRLFLQGESY